MEPRWSPALKGTDHRGVLEGSIVGEVKLLPVHDVPLFAVAPRTPDVCRQAVRAVCWPAEQMQEVIADTTRSWHRVVVASHRHDYFGHILQRRHTQLPVFHQAASRWHPA